MAQTVFTVKLDTRGLESIAKNLAPRAERLLDKAATNIERGAKRRAPVDTGALRNSIGWKRAGRFTRIIADGVEYGIDVEFGTGPHIIRPKSKRALAFNIGGKRIVRRYVFHPGTRPHPFLVPAVRAEIPYLTTCWRQLFR